jgi:hypothetical protein
MSRQKKKEDNYRKKMMMEELLGKNSQVKENVRQLQASNE